VKSDDPLRVLIVDDEPLARRRLDDLLAPKDDVEVAAHAENGREAARAVTEEQPDLAFLDVQMPGLSGVDVIREVGPDAMPPVVFVTAYDQYAIEAFELAALDYLVKPFDDERFEEAFERAREQVRLKRKEDATDQLLALLENERASRDEDKAPGPDRTGADEYLERIAVETPGRTRVIAVRDVDYVTADGSYAELHVGEDSYPIRKRMKTLEKRLDPDGFFRIHRSTIVRLERIVSLITGGGGHYAAELEDGTRLRVSRGRYEALRERLGLRL
jgi:two-component system LytT family response regulator